MASIISLSCNAAEIHHQYVSIHKNLFGTVSFRKIIAAIKGHKTTAYKEDMESLEQLQKKLQELAADTLTADAGNSPHIANLMQNSLTEYITALDSVIISLQSMCRRLSEDEDAYRYAPAGKQSKFKKDTIRYDQELLSLEQLGNRLNKLFSQF